MNSRLLFAAARGAKVEEHIGGNRWVEVSLIRLVNADQCEYRICPRHKHLEYGPISTALRDVAFKMEDDDDILGCVAHGGLFKMEWNYYDVHSFALADLETRVTFLLILAEALADEGL